MLPIRQKRPDRRHKGERLVQHNVMPRLGNLDHWSRPAQQIEHIFPDFHRHQDRIFAPHQRDSTFCGFQSARCVPDLEPLPDFRVKFPGPAPLNPLERGPSDVIGGIEVFTRLRRCQSEPRRAPHPGFCGPCEGALVCQVDRRGDLVGLQGYLQSPSQRAGLHREPPSEWR